MFVLARRSAAVRDGRQILAEVRATGVNSDGRTVGLTAPSGTAQQRCDRCKQPFVFRRGHVLRGDGEIDDGFCRRVIDNVGCGQEPAGAIEGTNHEVGTPPFGLRKLLERVRDLVTPVLVCGRRTEMLLARHVAIEGLHLHGVDALPAPTVDHAAGYAETS